MAFLTDGFQTTISSAIAGFALILTEREVQPPGMDLGGPIDVATMRSVGWRTKAPASLRNIEDITMQCSYDPAAYGIIVGSFMGVIVGWTITFPDGSTIVVYGWLESFKPVSHKEKDFPLAEVKICLTPNRDVNGVTQTIGYVGKNGSPSIQMVGPKDASQLARD